MFHVSVAGVPCFSTRCSMFQYLMFHVSVPGVPCFSTWCSLSPCTTRLWTWGACRIGGWAACRPARRGSTSTSAACSSWVASPGRCVAWPLTHYTDTHTPSASAHRRTVGMDLVLFIGPIYTLVHGRGV